MTTTIGADATSIVNAPGLSAQASLTTIIAAAAGAGGAVVIAIAGGLFYYLRHRRLKRKVVKADDTSHRIGGAHGTIYADYVTATDFAMMTQATNPFSPSSYTKTPSLQSLVFSQSTLSPVAYFSEPKLPVQ